MPKVKTNSAAKKRFKKVGKNKIKYSCASRRHLMTGKSNKRKRQLRKGSYICKADLKHIQLLLPN